MIQKFVFYFLEYKCLMNKSNSCVKQVGRPGRNLEIVLSRVRAEVSSRPESAKMGSQATSVVTEAIQDPKQGSLLDKIFAFPRYELLSSRTIGRPRILRVNQRYQLGAHLCKCFPVIDRNEPRRPDDTRGP